MIGALRENRNAVKLAVTSSRHFRAVSPYAIGSPVRLLVAIFTTLVLLLGPVKVHAQANIRTADPCFGTLKSSVAINVTSATTTSLVSIVGNNAIYVCGFVMTIAPSATSADTAQFEYGTGTTCTSPTVLTGTFGNGDLTASAGVAVISYGIGGTSFVAPSGTGLCIVTTGTAVNVQGVVTYVQQGS